MAQADAVEDVVVAEEMATETATAIPVDTKAAGMKAREETAVDGVVAVRAVEEMAAVLVAGRTKEPVL